MKTIAESIRYYIHKGMTSFQAENYVCQRIVLSKSPSRRLLTRS